MTLYVLRFFHHGVITFRPQCETSAAFCELLKQKTLTADDIEGIKRLGYQVKIKEEEL